MRKIFFIFLLATLSSPALSNVRIIDGDKAPVGAWPATAALLLVDKIDEGNFEAQFCGASIIASNWVLTAAHCVEPSIGAPHKPEDIEVLVNTQDLNSGGERIKVSRIVRQAKFDIDDINNDIALLKLETDITIPAIQVLNTTAPLGSDPGNANAIVTGWGVTNTNNSDRPNHLQQLSLPVIAHNKCKDAYDSGPLDDLFGIDIEEYSMLCAGFEEEGKDSCYGDSGGPLMVLDPDNPGAGIYKQIGVVSFGKGCGTKDAYGVYTRLSTYADWIQSLIDGTLPLENIPQIVGGDKEHDVSAFAVINYRVAKLVATDANSTDLGWDLVGGDLSAFKINDNGELKVIGPLQPGKTYELNVKVSDGEDGMDMAVIKVKAKFAGGGGSTSIWLLSISLLVLICRQSINSSMRKIKAI